MPSQKCSHFFKQEMPVERILAYQVLTAEIGPVEKQPIKHHI